MAPRAFHQDNDYNAAPPMRQVKPAERLSDTAVQPILTKFLERSTKKKNAYMHPDSILATQGILHGPSSGPSGGLTMHYLRRIEAGLRGEDLAAETREELVAKFGEDALKGTRFLRKADDVAEGDAVVAPAGDEEMPDAVAETAQVIDELPESNDARVDEVIAATMDEKKARKLAKKARRAKEKEEQQLREEEEEEEEVSTGDEEMADADEAKDEREDAGVVPRADDELPESNDARIDKVIAASAPAADEKKARKLAKKAQREKEAAEQQRREEEEEQASKAQTKKAKRKRDDKGASQKDWQSKEEFDASRKVEEGEIGNREGAPAVQQNGAPPVVVEHDADGEVKVPKKARTKEEKAARKAARKAKRAEEAEEPAD